MGYIANHSITLGAPALKDATGKETRTSTLKTLQAGEAVPRMAKAELERLLELGAIVEVKGKAADDEGGNPPPPPPPPPAPAPAP